MKRFLLSLFLLPGLALASNDADGEEALELFGTIDLGLAWLSEDSDRFGRYSGLDQSGFSPLAQFSLRWPAAHPEGWSVRLEGARLGQDSRRLDLDARQGGGRSFSLNWIERPGWRLSGGSTPFRHGPGGRLVLPNDWTALETSAELSGRKDGFDPVDIRADRRRLDLDYWQRFRDRWRVAVSASEERRDGQRLIGAIFGYTGGNPRGMLLPAAVDDTTQRIESRLTYADPNGHQFGLAWSGSFYRNERSGIEFDNPWSRHPQWAPGTGYPQGAGRIADHPDNSAHQLRAFGAWRLGERSRAGFDVAYGLMRQNDLLLPYTVNKALEIEQPLPVARLDAEIRTTVANLRLVTQWSDRLSLTANYRFDDRDNRTPSYAWRGIGADAEDQPSADEARVNLPYSLRRQSLALEARWRLAGYQRLSAGLNVEQEDRDEFAEVAELDEWGGEVGWRGRLGSKIRWRVDGVYSVRRFDEYIGRAPFRAGRLPGTVDPDDFENHPELRKYNVADRDRSLLKLRLDAQPTTRLSLGLTARYHRDDYDDERFGLNQSVARTLSADFGWQLGGSLSLSGLYGRDRYRADQSGRAWPGFAPALAFDPTRDWWASHEDRIETASLSLSWLDPVAIRRALGSLGMDGSAEIGVDTVYVSARGDIDVRAAEALEVEPLPETSSRRRSAALWTRYTLPSGWRIQLRIEHERLSTRDYAYDAVSVDSVSNLLLLGQDAPDYSVTAILASFGYRF
jgi:MtrB/PioB family decaheme-associated outer membrane protein